MNAGADHAIDLPLLPLRLYPSRIRIALLTLLGLAFTASGVVMVRTEGGAAAWFTVIFFGICTAVIAASFLPGCSYLELGPDGFTMRALFRTSRLRWRDVGTFRAGRIGVSRRVLFDMAQDYQAGTTARSIARTLAGSEGALPDTYGKKAAELAALMNAYRERALRDGQGT